VGEMSCFSFKIYLVTDRIPKIFKTNMEVPDELNQCIAYGNTR
jgi:hypothetical protein